MAWKIRVWILGFLGNNKALYEEVQDLIIHTWSKMNKNKAPQSLEAYCHLP
jgi:hypothetical protein